MAASGSAAGLSTAEQALLTAVTAHGEAGCDDAALNGSLPATSLAERADALNALLKKGRLNLLRAADSDTLLYRAVSAEEAVKFKGLSSEDVLVYQIIQQASNTGIWTKDLKLRSNLQQPQVTKVLKTLEARSLIKAVKSVANKNRKVYMLMDLEPSTEITGGAWYTENEFDSEFIDVLRRSCLKFIETQGAADLEQVCQHIDEQAVATVTLGHAEVLQIVNTLVYDGVADQHVSGGELGRPKGTVYYTPATLSIPENSAFTSIPCGVCPVFNECGDGGIISPQTCAYYSEWLDW